jgi:hypothetical protein
MINLSFFGIEINAVVLRAVTLGRQAAVDYPHDGSMSCISDDSHSLLINRLLILPTHFHALL